MGEAKAAQAQAANFGKLCRWLCNLRRLPRIRDAWRGNVAGNLVQVIDRHWDRKFEIFSKVFARRCDVSAVYSHVQVQYCTSQRLEPLERLHLTLKIYVA